MSVILGYKAKDKLFLGADNRAVTIDDNFSRDDDNKIIVINNEVAVACAGCNKSQMLFNILIKNIKDKTDFRVEDALKCIKKIYRLCKILWFHNFSKEILSIGSQFLVVGKNKKDECCIYIVMISHGKLEPPLLKEWFIFPPFGADIKGCFDLFSENALKYPDDFIQRTVKDIAATNKFISSSGDIWIYDMITGKSTLEHFT